MNIDPEIVDVLACPACKGKLWYDKHEQKLICKFDKVSYPVEKGVPILLVERAWPIKED